MVDLYSRKHFRNHFTPTLDKRPFFNIIIGIIGTAFLLASSPVYAQENTPPSSIKGHWVTPNYDFKSGKPEDRGAAAVAMVYSKKNKAVGVTIYVSPAMPKEKAERYGEGMMKIFAKKDIPANYYIQRVGKSTDEGIAFDFFVHGYFFGKYSGKDTAAGIKLAIDGFNGEPYVREMLDEGSL